MKFVITKYPSAKYFQNLDDAIDAGVFTDEYLFKELAKWVGEETLKKFFESVMRDNDIEVVEEDDEEVVDGLRKNYYHHSHC